MISNYYNNPLVRVWRIFLKVVKLFTLEGWYFDKELAQNNGKLVVGFFMALVEVEGGMEMGRYFEISPIPGHFVRIID